MFPGPDGRACAGGGKSASLSVFLSRDDVKRKSLFLLCLWTISSFFHKNPLRDFRGNDIINIGYKSREQVQTVIQKGSCNG